MKDSFFFHCAAPPRDLHSFPTRRSSDLFASATVHHPFESRLKSKTACTPSTLYSTTAFARERSEEHTSELQSRGHLVCRLLLEKKNVGQYTAGNPATIARMTRYAPVTRL